MPTIIIITPPPKKPNQAQASIHGEPREFEVPDDMSLSEALRFIADSVEGEQE